MKNSNFFVMHSNKYITRLLTVAFVMITLITTSVYAQVIDISICDSTDRFPITGHISIFKTESKLTIDSIEEMDPAFFQQAPDKPVLVYNYDPYYYWFRIIVNNKTGYRKDIMLLMAPIGMRDGKLFQRNNQKYAVIGESGIKYAFRDRPYQFAHNVFPFSILSQSQDTLYLFADASNVYKSFGFALIKPKDLKVFENKVYFIFGIIAGLLLLFFIINVSLFFVFKLNIHLWYALYISFLFLIVMKNDHLDQQFLHWDSELAYQLTPYMAIGAIAISILAHVAHLFFKKVIIKGSLLYRISFAAKINVLLSGFAHFTFFCFKLDYHFLSFAFNWAKYSTLVAILVIIIDCFYSIRQGFKSAFFILSGLLVFFIGAIQRLFFPSTLSFLFPPTTFHIGIILETLIISLGLIYQYYWIEKEKEVQIQEQALRHSSLEIHGNIAPTLTFAKLYISGMRDNSSALVSETANKAYDQLQKAINDLRALGKSLNSTYVSETDFVNLIKDELTKAGAASKCETVFEVNGQPYTVPHHLSFFRIFQEILDNAVRHANATRLSVILSFSPDCFELSVADDGVGFNPQLIYEKNNNSLGMRNLKDRVNVIGGKYTIETSPGAGTKIVVSKKMSRYR